MRSRIATLASILCLAGCGGGAEPTADAAPNSRWSVAMMYGFEGSSSVWDLDHDGRPEGIVPLTSFFSDTSPDSYVVALDAASGLERWRTAERVGGFGYPFCADLDGDGVDDVLTSGRSRDVEALSGKDGALLWSLAARNPGLLQGGTYSVVAESPTATVLFVTNGGGGNPEVSQPDVPGQLVAFDRAGLVLGTFPEPDLAEIYSSAAVARTPAAGLIVAFGSGGERLGGRLHLVQYDEGPGAFTPLWAIPSACATGGFVASPTFGDLTGDGVPEVVDEDYCGVVHAVGLDGTSHPS